MKYIIQIILETQVPSETKEEAQSQASEWQKSLVEANDDNEMLSVAAVKVIPCH